MNREIKFRAWDSKSQRMYYQGEPDLEDIQSFFHHYNDNDKLMQFTGLHDKNGKEIYEGDIVERRIKVIEEEIVYIEKVVFVSGAFQRECKEKELGDFYEAPFQTFEIIGNIHENPELTK